MENLEIVIKEFFEDNLPASTQRELKVPLDINKIITIYGLRRSGKTYYLYQLIEKLMRQGYEKKNIIYINFEDERLDGLKASDLGKIVELSYQLRSGTKAPVYFLDEIQEVAGWEKFVRRLLEKEKAKIFLSGSSSKLLSKEIATALRGRTLSYLLFPFSFGEFLKSKKFNAQPPFTSEEKGKLNKHINQYLEFGGYPEIINYSHQEKLRTLKEYYDLIIYRDLIERFDIKQLGLLKLLIRAAVESTAKEFSLRKYYNFLKTQGRKVSKNTLYAYYAFLEEINFVIPLKKLSWKLREIEGSIPKSYLGDVGYLTLFGKEDLGQRLENLVFLALMREKHYSNILLEVFYYKTKDDQEIDFAVKIKNKIKTLIQVSLTLEDYRTYNRETASLINAAEETGCNNLLIITKDQQKTISLRKHKILLVPLWRWLLNPKEFINI